MPDLNLISFDACPFVQRAAILLEEQGREYEITYIDLRDKPDWFLDISPHGKVPVLRVDGAPIFESAVILDYLDETAERGKLLPTDPVARAQQRMWITFISGIMAKAWSLQAAGAEAGVRTLSAELKDQFRELLRNRPSEGPYWAGERFSMVDAAIAPILQRLTWADRLEPTLKFFDDLAEAAAWRDVLLARPSTTASIVPDLEQRSGRMLAEIGSWIARDVKDAA